MKNKAEASRQGIFSCQALHQSSIEKIQTWSKKCESPTQITYSFSFHRQSSTTRGRNQINYVSSKNYEQKWAQDTSFQNASGHWQTPR